VRVVGVMSGTSLDGIDVAIVEIRNRKVKTLGFQFTPYAAPLRDRILAVSNRITHTREISRLNFELAELYAGAVRRAAKRWGPVDLIGCHGQTIYHEGRSNTLQLGEPAVIAERTGTPVVSNFRARDIAAGGEGAPLVPYVDYLLFRHPKRTRAVLNIGGIANVTILPAGASPEEVTAFDTGPGNMVIDALVRWYSKGALGFDRGGRIAASGKVNRRLLDQLLHDPYYRRKPPKSAGREQYGPEFVARFTRAGLPPADLIATATALTAAAAALGIGQTAGDLIVSGGGVHNPQIMNYLAAFLPQWAISSSNDHGIPADAKEAIAFAILAARTWRAQPGNLPSATGARRSVILGDITR
jgi:anhydro-N-acetylmuramic acid kinase